MNINSELKEKLIEEIKDELIKELKEEILEALLEKYKKNNSNYKVERIVFETRGEAEQFLHEINGILNEYGVVRVADLYDLAGVTSNYTDNKYGWTDLKDAEVTQYITYQSDNKERYYIKLPMVTIVE